MATTLDPISEFIEAASVPLDAWHASGGLYEANQILAKHPEIGKADIFAAATLGDADAVKSFLLEDKESATRKGGPRYWDPLTYLCFSRYLKSDRSRSDGFLEAAKALLDQGADAKTGWFENNHQPKPEWESALYGACGIAHHPEMTQLLLDHGADPNDGEVIYHTPETYDNRAMKVLVGTGKLTPESFALLLLRKADWHDYEGAKWLVENGADPNCAWGRGNTPLLHAIRRDNDLKILEVLVEHGADPTLESGGWTAVTLAARRGRGDALNLFEQKGFKQNLDAVNAVIAACAKNDEPAVRELGLAHPEIIEGLRTLGGELLSNFAGNGNATGLQLLIETGAPVWSVYEEGDAYYGIAQHSMALHSAAWRIQPEAVKVLINRGADVNAEDARGRTPLMLAVDACVSSYWKERRTPECVALLLQAGATLKGINGLSGYEDVDNLLIEAGLQV